MRHIWTLLLLPVMAASAVSVNPLAPAQNFNAFVSGDATLQKGHFHGGLAVGGDLYLKNSNTYDFVNGIKTPYQIDGKTVQLVVDGGIKFQNNGTVRFSGGQHEIRVGDLTGVNVFTKDNNNTPINTRLGTTTWNSNRNIELNVKESAATISGPSGIDFDAAFSSLQANSAAIAQLTTNGSYTVQSNRATLNITSGVANVFTFTDAQLDAFSEINFSKRPDINTPVIFNITSTMTNFVWTPGNFNGLGDETDASYILFNFYNATGSITMGQGGKIHGSILATNADVIAKNSSDYVGQIVAKTLTHNGAQIHDSPFRSNLDLPLAPVSVPDHGRTLLLFGVSLAAIVISARRFGALRTVRG